MGEAFTFFGVIEMEIKEEPISDSKYDKMISKKTKGLVEKIEETILDFKSAAMMVKSKKVSGSYLSIKTADGTDVVEFPRVFSDPEKGALLNNEVEYSNVHFSIYEGGAGYILSWEFMLKLTGGPYKGWELKDGIVV